jgi:hypothetical protein
MFALPNSGHLEFGFVPADHDVEGKPALPHVVSGDHLLGCDHRIEQRRMDSAENG